MTLFRHNLWCLMHSTHFFCSYFLYLWYTIYYFSSCFFLLSGTQELPRVLSGGAGDRRGNSWGRAHDLGRAGTGRERGNARAGLGRGMESRAGAREDSVVSVALGCHPVGLQSSPILLRVPKTKLPSPSRPSVRFGHSMVLSSKIKWPLYPW